MTTLLVQPLVNDHSSCTTFGKWPLFLYNLWLMTTLLVQPLVNVQYAQLFSHNLFLTASCCLDMFWILKCLLAPFGCSLFLFSFKYSSNIYHVIACVLLLLLLSLYVTLRYSSLVVNLTGPRLIYSNPHHLLLKTRMSSLSIMQLVVFSCKIKVLINNTQNTHLHIYS